MRALSFFAGFVVGRDHNSFLDVGAGTGRAVSFLLRRFPSSFILGVEPSAELREAGIRSGTVSDTQIVDGDALCLPFKDDEFDWVVETGVLHHIRDFKAAVKEMSRVARCGVLISDSNNIGQGSGLVRLVKRVVKGLGLFKPLVWVQTRGKGYKWSEGDGVYYSFCAFDSVPILREKFDQFCYFNTSDSGFDLYGSSGTVAIIACKE